MNNIFRIFSKRFRACKDIAYEYFGNKDTKIREIFYKDEDDSINIVTDRIILEAGRNEVCLYMRNPRTITLYELSQYEILINHNYVARFVKYRYKKLNDEIKLWYKLN